MIFQLLKMEKYMDGARVLPSLTFSKFLLKSSPPSSRTSRPVSLFSLYVKAEDTGYSDLNINVADHLDILREGV